MSSDAADPFVIRYRFVVEDGTRAEFELELDPETLSLPDPGLHLPEWTRLEFHQCPHCPLNPVEHPHCPVAAQLARLVPVFDHLPSHARARVEVTAGERTTMQDTALRRGVSSLMGLLMATSGCPVTMFFRPMARFHLPMATPDETIYRAAATFLLARYIGSEEGESIAADLEGLTEIYRDMQILNRAMAERVRAATRTDSSVNAVIMLDTFALQLPMEVEDHLPRLASFFRPYLEWGGREETYEAPDDSGTRRSRQ